jgi:uncharacterized protein with GYD domain
MGSERREGVMSKYISLVNWTDEGAKHADGTVDRAEAAKKQVADMGGSLEVYWTMGHYDMVVVSEFADDETAVAFLAKLASLGNVRTQTMRAFDADDVRGIMSKM